METSQGEAAAAVSLVRSASSKMMSIELTVFVDVPLQQEAVACAISRISTDGNRLCVPHFVLNGFRVSRMWSMRLQRSQPTSPLSLETMDIRLMTNLLSKVVFGSFDFVITLCRSCERNFATVLGFDEAGSGNHFIVRRIRSSFWTSRGRARKCLRTPVAIALSARVICFIAKIA
jgi:hypothetical protein